MYTGNYEYFRYSTGPCDVLPCDSSTMRVPVIFIAILFTQNELQRANVRRGLYRDRTREHDPRV